MMIWLWFLRQIVCNIEVYEPHLKSYPMVLSEFLCYKQIIKYSAWSLCSNEVAFCATNSSNLSLASKLYNICTLIYIKVKNEPMITTC